MPKKTQETTLVQLSTEGTPKLHCPVCNKGMGSLNGYVAHVKKHEPPGGFCCRFCDARYCNDSELKRHHNEVHTIIACRICKDITFTHEDEYRLHISAVHNGIDREMFKCDKCGAEYKTYDPYRRHITTDCGSQKPYKCKICDLTFVTKYNLKHHIESHGGERKFCCSYCGKDFLQKGRLVEHERSHTGEKPYKCDVCGKCFAHRESIVTHSSIHTGIRLVECKCCQSRFSCYSNLIKHRRTRPGSCGLPEYDPPKNRTRTHRSRIPATLNPTSEIKVSGHNKILKDVDKHKIQIKIKKEKSFEKEKLFEKETTKRRRAQNKRINNATEVKVKKENVTEGETASENETNVFSACKIQNTCTKQQNKEKKKKLEIIAAKLAAKNSDSDTEGSGIQEFLTSYSDSNLKVENHPLSEDEIIESNEVNEKRFEYTPYSHFVNAGHAIKAENDNNIFDEKDTLLDCLLNGSDNVEPQIEVFNLSTMPENQKNVYENVRDVLEEKEIILDGNNDVLANDEEDIFQQKTLKKKRKTPPICQTLKDEEHIKVVKNDEIMNETTTNSSTPRKRRRYRKSSMKRMKTTKPDNTPKRTAKITQQELRTRLNLMAKSGKSWSCAYCIKVYHMRRPFEKHLREDHNRPEEEIKKTFETVELAEIHDEVFTCKICDKMYLVEKRLLAHIKLHGPDGKLIHKCPCYCNTYFNTKEEALEHGHRVHRNIMYCNICEKYMNSPDSLKNHMKHNHADEPTPREKKRNLVCEKCGKKFAGRTSLTDHVRSDCGRIPLYPCPICDKHLTTAGILKTHMLLHKDETPFQCEQCGKTFKVKAQYKTHIKTRHTEYKPFKCHLCPKEYPYRESLLTHMTVHTGIKRFLCNGCCKRFTCISNLQAHRRVNNETCGQLPLNAKATQYMGVQKGNLLLGAKPEAGIDYKDTNTLVAKEVIDPNTIIAKEVIDQEFIKILKPEPDLDEEFYMH